MDGLARKMLHYVSTFPSSAYSKLGRMLCCLAQSFLMTLAGAWLVQCVTASGARAIDILPRDYLALPSGTNLAAFYYDLIRSSEFNIAAVGTSKNNTDLHVDVGVYRQIYYGDIGGRSWAAEVVVPFGTEAGQIAGNTLGRSTGVGDILVAAGISFLPRLERTYNIAMALYVSMPTGSYSSVQRLSLGANRWSFDSQIGYTQAIGNKFWFDAAADVIMYTNNDDVGVYHATLGQQPTYQGQVWFSYVPDKSSLVSVGYAVQVGGAQNINGINTGIKTESEQVRFAYSKSLTNQFQVVGSVAHDVSVTGGFKKDVEALFRALYTWR